MFTCVWRHICLYAWRHVCMPRELWHPLCRWLTGTIRDVVICDVDGHVLTGAREAHWLTFSKKKFRRGIISDSWVKRACNWVWGNYFQSFMPKSWSWVHGIAVGSGHCGGLIGQNTPFQKHPSTTTNKTPCQVQKRPMQNMGCFWTQY